MSVALRATRALRSSRGGCLRDRRPVSPAATAATAGFTLIEVLVALIILSIGVLGVAKLTLTATRANDSAYVRTQATEFAYTIIDAMRANRQNALNGAYQIALGTPAVAGPDCYAAPCTAATDLANYDLASWKKLLATSLPGGDGSVTTVTGAGGQVTAVVVVQWNDAVASATFNQTAAGTNAYVNVTLETLL